MSNRDMGFWHLRGAQSGLDEKRKHSTCFSRYKLIIFDGWDACKSSDQAESGRKPQQYLLLQL